MRTHPKARLGLAGRHDLCLEIESGLSIRGAARLFKVSPATAKKWWDRWQQASEAEGRSLQCLQDRSSRPHRSPNELPADEQERIWDPPA